MACISSICSESLKSRPWSPFVKGASFGPLSRTSLPTAAKVGNGKGKGKNRSVPKLKKILIPTAYDGETC